jgi:hypothetical protein
MKAKKPVIADPFPDRHYYVERRVVAHSNDAANYYFTVGVEYIAFEAEGDEVLLVATEESLEELHEPIRAIVESLQVKDGAVAEHPEVERVFIEVDDA